MKKNLFLFNILLIVVVVLTSCNLPSEDIGEGLSLTAAAQTVEALLSATPSGGGVPPSLTSGAPAFTLTPSLTPLPSSTNTPLATATSNCNVAQFIADVTIPDGTILTPNQAFTKTWRFKNVGTCTWTTAYAAVFSNGNSMNGPVTQTLTGNVNPGQTVDISMNLQAPGGNGDYTGYWRLRDGSGVLFNQFYVQIKVQTAATPTNTLPPAIVFAVTSVTYSLGTWNDAGHTNCPRITANITTNGAGSVTYHWTRSDNSTAPTNTLVFGSAGTQSINYDWALGSVWAGTNNWVGIYIDSPNHQDFGHQSFTTACTVP